MTRTVDDDFEGFVAARWPELETVALVATLDPEPARALVTEALAGLRGRWSQAVEQGAPTAAARSAVLAAVAALPDRREPSAVRGAPLADDASAVPAALLETLARETPLVRAVLAAGSVWELDPRELAPLLGRGHPAVLDAARQARDRLLAAHREARATDGLAPADHHLDDDLAELVDRLTAGRPEPPDPAALVAERSAGLRRRQLLLGAGAVAVTAAGATWFVRGAAGAGAPRPAATTPAPPGPRDPVWAFTSRWPARGPLANDAGIRALVTRAGGPGTRLVYAADLPGVRAAVAVVPQVDDTPGLGSTVKLWSGAPGTPAERLAEVPLALQGVYGTSDLVAVGIPAGDTGVLLVLTRPTVRSVDFSPVVTLTQGGSIQRIYARLALSAGITAFVLDQRFGTGGRVRAVGYDGPVPAPEQWGGVDMYGDDPARSLVQQVASATGLPPARLVARILVDSPTDGSVLDATALSPRGEDGRVRVALVRTPERAVVRLAVVSDDGRGSGGILFDAPKVVPAELAEDPLVIPLDTLPPSTGRYLVVVPGGGATCQFLLADTRRAVSPRTPMKGRTAVLLVENDDGAGPYRLVVRDRSGAVVYDAVPTPGRDLQGGDADVVEEPTTGWLGLPSDQVP
ncbi:hypothetical protein [Phycicoccus duodecadis]|uniref:Uncharacterized protein n=1 Tax=Phycicoccus duodecadis TaxID=173053 RepID=A0A2N3YIH4_9MICO|nr:hypothetical protein [Phycicoccus duodecadis]PKW26639.1 hypothetical protein ATL31_1455 [Phycicoccus duodecadis]